MSFENDKSDSYFTQGVWRCCFNRAISLFPAEKTEGIGEAMPFCWFAADFMYAAVQNLCSTIKGIEWDSATVHYKKARVDTSVANPKDRPHSSCILPNSPVVTCIMLELCRRYKFPAMCFT